MHITCNTGNILGRQSYRVRTSFVAQFRNHFAILFLIENTNYFDNKYIHISSSIFQFESPGHLGFLKSSKGSLNLQINNEHLRTCAKSREVRYDLA